jgi:glucose/arabinose dehydrogenase
MKTLTLPFLLLLSLSLAACSSAGPAAITATPPPAPTATSLPTVPPTAEPPAAPTEPGAEPAPPATETPVPSPTPDPNVYTFAAIGDYGLWSNEEEQVANLVKSWDPAFIITLGDNNYPNGAADTIDQNIGQFYHEFIHPYKGEYGPGAKTNRFFPSLGNHDWVTEGAQPYLDYFELPGNERYYDFVRGPVHFFALNADTHEPDGVGRSSVQAQWLQAALAASTARWQVVYMHQPPYSSGRHGSTDYMQWPFAEWGADAVLAGHDHSYERLIVDGIPYIVNGLGGHLNRYFFFTRIEGSQFQYRSGHGALRVSVTAETVTFEMVTVDGEVLDSHTLSGSSSSLDVPVSVSQLPDPSGFAWEEVADGYVQPLLATNAGDASGRLFVVEQAGQIHILGREQAFLDIRSRVGSAGNEQGLLGLAFHPDHESNGLFYVNYTDLSGDTVVASYRVFSEQPDLADPTSEQVLVTYPQPFRNHNGGHLAVGPDGALYISSGDGGSGGDPAGNAQNQASLLGKILRLDLDSGAVEVFASGLRNPWRFAFDSQTGDMYIADVGQNIWEEVNFLPAGVSAGANFGWDYLEGSHPFEGQLPVGLETVMPIAEYSHSEGGCSVTGGEVYRGPGLEAFQGVYLYGDFCSGLVWGLVRDPGGAWQSGLLFSTPHQITSFGLDEQGALYLVARQGGIYRLAAP